MPAAEAPALVLGPMLRYLSETEATIWVETDRACQVEILGRQAATFEVSGHHYGLVVIEGLEPGSEHEYRVTLDGTERWPAPGPDSAGGFPPSVLRTLTPGRQARLAFGSCRVAEIAPGNLGRRAATAGAGTDALAATAYTLRGTPRDRWPDVLLMIGDQVYADEPGPATRQFIAEHRATAPQHQHAPDDEVADFAEYCALYQEAWSEPAVRWLLSVVPSAMIFDDHDVHDDWNISAAWRRDFTAKPWWGRRVESAYQSYWVYQHLGNLAPAELARDETWAQVRQPGDAAPVLADLARRADERAPGVRFSFARTFGGVRVVMLDSRSRRVVDGTRLIAERLRRTVDLEHWPAFGGSFARLERLLTELAAGQHSPGGEPPVSVTIISGDIHHSYLTVVDLPEPGQGQHEKPGRSKVFEAVCSPFHQAMPPKMVTAQQLASSRLGGLAGTAVARLAGARRPRISWRITQGPWFENMIAVLEYNGATARLRFDRSRADAAGEPRLELVQASTLTE